MRRLASWFSVLFLSAVILTYISFILTDNFFYYESDFLPFYVSAKIFREDFRKIYDFETILSYEKKLFPAPYKTEENYAINPFINTPYLILLYLPLSYLPPRWGYFTAAGLMAVILGIDLYLLYRLFAPKEKAVFPILTALSFAPSFVTIFQTQNSLVTLLIIIGCYSLIKREKYFQTGLLASLLLYKLQIAVVVLAFLMLLRKGKIIAGFLCGGLLVFFISALMLGGDINIFIKANLWYVLQYEQQPVNNLYMISWQGFITQLYYLFNGLKYATLMRISALFLSIITVISAGIKILKIPKIENFLPEIFSLMCITILLSAMHVQSHEAVLLLFPFFVFISKAANKMAIIVFLGWLIFLLSFFTPFYPRPLYLAPTLYLFLIFKLISGSFGRNQTAKVKSGRQ